MNLALKAIICATMALVVVSCSSSKKEVKEEKRKFQKDYVLVDASSDKVPQWIEKPSKGDSKKNRKKFRYFVSESSNANKRLCKKSASARATANIATEVAQFMKNSYGESTQNDGDSDVTEYMEETLAQEAQTFLVGVQKKAVYWEKRKYKEELGADEDQTKFVCYALMRMSKKSLDKALKNSMAKLYSELEPEVKKKTKKALDDANKAFINLDKRVEIEE